MKKKNLGTFLTIFFTRKEKNNNPVYNYSVCGGGVGWVGGGMDAQMPFIYSNIHQTHSFLLSSRGYGLEREMRVATVGLRPF